MKQAFYCKKLPALVLVCCAVLFASAATSPSALEEPELSELLGPPPFEDAGIVNVEVPVCLDFTLDPIEVAGLGQVYSPQYAFRNLGDTDILLNIVGHEVIFASDGHFSAVPYAIGMGFADSPPQKTIQLLLNIGGSQLVLTDAAAGNLEIPLTAGQTVTAGIGGSMNPYPTEEWRNGDVKIKVHYQITPVIALAADISESTTEGGIETIEPETETEPAGQE